MSGIFINYRGEDSQTAAALIDRELRARFGGDLVFLDSRSIPVGADFADELLGRLRACSVLLVVIGPRWLTLTDSAGRPRIDDPQDWIRREIVEAFAHGLRVVPVLTDGATLPAQDDLPADLVGLSRRQYVPLRHRYTEVDLTFLVERIIEADAELANAAAQCRPSIEAIVPTLPIDDPAREQGDGPVDQDGYDIVISYSSNDEDIARQLHQYLTYRGFSVWRYANAVLGGDNITDVFDVIGRCRYLLIILSQSSVASNFVKHELSVAKMREIQQDRVVIIPLLYEDCATPASLRASHAIDLRKSSFEAMIELDRALRRAPSESSPGEAAIPRQVSAAIAERVEGPRLEDTDRMLIDAMRGRERLVLAMDVGGTKAYVSLMNEATDRLFDKKYSTEGRGEQADLVRFIRQCIRESIDTIHEKTGMSVRAVEDRIEAIGIAFAGPTDPARGVVLDAPNFNVRDCPLADLVTEAFAKPTYIDNDVNLGVVGEMSKGVARGHDNVVGIIIGTGVGGGLAINGRLYRGAGNTAGEIGHIVIDQNSSERCGCGQFGCFEALASRQAIARNLARAKLAKGDDALQWREQNLGSSDLAIYYNQNDPDARATVLAAARVCGKAVFSILNLLNPDLIFFGGGFVRHLGEPFLQPIREEAAKCMNTIYEVHGGKVPIELGELTNPMLVGACLMAMNGARFLSDGGRDQVIESIVDSIGERAMAILTAIYQHEAGTPISRDPASDFYEDRLRPLRNAGLIRTENGLSFRKSATVHVTDLGRLVVEEKLTSRRRTALPPARRR